MPGYNATRVYYYRQQLNIRKQKLAEKDDVIHRLQVHLAGKKFQLQSTDHFLQAAQSTIASLTSQISQISAELSQKKTEIEAKDKKIAELQEELDKAKSELLDELLKPMW